jgi:lipopolysaccharide export system ATP-binding protein
MVDILGMFRRRPAKRGPAGFARSREDITALGDSFGDMLTSPVRDAPPMARTAPVPVPGLELPRPQPAPEPSYEERPRAPNPQVPNPQAPRAQAPRAQAPKTNGAAAPRFIKRPGYLAVHSVEKSFGTRQVVRGVSIYVRRGEAVGLLGPNGAGKTTVFYMITGLIKADRGAIELDGHDVTKLPMYQRARLGIGYLPQEASIFRGLTVEQNIRAVLEVVEPNKKKREAELNSLLEEFNITRLRKSPSIALSGGERRRVEIARALATRPNYMLLDEPFAGIDPIAVGDIQDLVRHLTNRGIGVLITDHNVRETLGLTDRAYIVYAGQILTEGSPEEIVNDPDVRRLYLGEEFRL